MLIHPYIVQQLLPPDKRYYSKKPILNPLLTCAPYALLRLNESIFNICVNEDKEDRREKVKKLKYFFYVYTIDKTLYYSDYIINVEYTKLSMDFLREYKDKLDWSIISANFNISMSMIEENLDLPWDWEYIVYNPNIDGAFVARNESLIFTRENLIYIYAIKDVKMDLIEKYYKKYKFEFGLPNYIKNKDRIKNASLNKDMGYYCQHAKLAIDFIEKNIDIINWYRLSFNKNISEDIILKYGAKMSKGYLSCNEALNISFIISNPDLSLSIERAMEVSKITANDIMNNPQIEWDYSLLSSNKCINSRFILQNKDKNWDYHEILRNIRHSQIKKILKRHIAHKYIFKWRAIVKRNKCYRRELFEPILDMYKLRIRDLNNGLRNSLITKY